MLCFCLEDLKSHPPFYPGIARYPAFNREWARTTSVLLLLPVIAPQVGEQKLHRIALIKPSGLD